MTAITTTIIDPPCLDVDKIDLPLGCAASSDGVRVHQYRRGAPQCLYPLGNICPYKGGGGRKGRKHGDTFFFCLFTREECFSAGIKTQNTSSTLLFAAENTVFSYVRFGGKWHQRNDAGCFGWLERETYALATPYLP